MDNDFQSMLNGYGLTTAEILYRMPDRRHLLQTFLWQDYDLFPHFPKLVGFCDFWQQKLEGPIFSVRVAHQKLIKPAEVKLVTGQFRLN
jgi:uncharacterized protein Usg